MRDKRLVPEDAEDIACAYASLLEREDVDPARSGLLGTCVGGAFALLAAADASIRDRVAFVAAFAPFSSMWTLVRDVVSGTSEDAGTIRSWAVDPLTRDVFARTVDRLLDTERARSLASARDRDGADAVLRSLPSAVREHLNAMSPIHRLADIHAPCIVIGHDRDDVVIPVGESRRLAAALAGRAGARYTEYTMFEHADPTKRRLSPLALMRELARFYRAHHPLFRQVT
jgi:dipeptidyl aminopeptidase/acylaminoacyl peptidase